MDAIRINRDIPKDALEPLHQALAQAVGEGKFSLSQAKGITYLNVHGTLTADEQNTAVQMANTFDITTRTDQQKAREAEKRQVNEALQVLRGDVTKLTPEQTQALLTIVLKLADTIDNR